MTSVVFSYLTSESIALLDFYVMYLFNDETLVTKQLSYKAVVLSDSTTAPVASRETKEWGFCSTCMQEICTVEKCRKIIEKNNRQNTLELYKYFDMTEL